MLLNFKVENFGVFKDEMNFSMKPGKTMERFEDNVVTVNPKLKISKLAVIVGENAGGKTSFMRSLHFLKHMFESTERISSIKKLCYNYEKDIPQKFELTVVADKRIFTYYLEIDDISVLKEKLEVRSYTQNESSNEEVYFYVRKNIKKISEDEFDVGLDISLNSKYISKEMEKLIISRGNKVMSGLFINYLNALELEIVKPLAEWVGEKLTVDIPADVSLNIYKRMSKDENDLKIIKSKEFLEIFSLVDSSIIDIKIDEEDPFRESKIIRRRKDDTELSINLKDDSSGVNEFFAWSVQIWKVLYQDITLFADELDKVLNSILASRVIALIRGSEHKGQFIFSSHNVLHLDTRSFMKEQLYIVNKDADNLESEIYSLADFDDYRYDKPKVYELYLKGLLGGVPND